MARLHHGRGRRRRSSGCSCRISDRDSSGATTENDGFSVVAATSSTTRFSTADSSASCWVLENRCTSSMNKHGLLAVRGGPAGDVDDGADLLDPGRQRRQRLEPAAGGLRDQRRQRGLAGAGRAVEDDRRRARPLDQPAQRRVRLQQVVLADHLVERWPGASAPPAAPTRRRAQAPPVAVGSPGTSNRPSDTLSAYHVTTTPVA